MSTLRTRLDDFKGGKDFYKGSKKMLHVITIDSNKDHGRGKFDLIPAAPR